MKKLRLRLNNSSKDTKLNNGTSDILIRVCLTIKQYSFHYNNIMHFNSHKWVSFLVKF